MTSRTAMVLNLNFPVYPHEVMRLQRQESDGGFEKFMLHFQSTKNVMSPTNASAQSKSERKRDRDVIVEYSKTGGLPWHLVIDTPGGHGEPIAIVTGVETAAEEQEEQHESEEEASSDIPRVEMFPMFDGKSSPQAYNFEPSTRDTKLFSSEEENTDDSMYKENKTRDKEKEPPQELPHEPHTWPTWEDDSPSSSSSVSASPSSISLPSEGKISAPKETVGKSQPSSTALPQEIKTDTVSPPSAPPQDHDDVLLEDFGQRPTHRLVDTRRRIRKLLGSEVVQTYGETTARKRIGNYRCCQLLCCRSAGEAQDFQEMYDPYDFGHYDDDIDATIKSFRRTSAARKKVNEEEEIMQSYSSSSGVASRTRRMQKSQHSKVSSSSQSLNVLPGSPTSVESSMAHPGSSSSSLEEESSPSSPSLERSGSSSK